jgi:hypothetical protein
MSLAGLQPDREQPSPADPVRVIYIKGPTLGDGV